MENDPSFLDMPGGERCALCGRSGLDEKWLWLEAQRLADHDCDFDQAELVFCSQEHAATYLAEKTIDWDVHDHSHATTGVRADWIFFGLGLVAIVLSAIGVVALVRWIL